MQSRIQAKSELDRIYSRRKDQWWQLSNEINQLFAKMMTEDTASAKKFRDAFVPGAAENPEITKLIQLQKVWSAIFPGQSISFADNRPVVQSTYSENTNPYSAQQMSDGERVALYLAGRVLDSEQQIIVINEPEVHFHSRLATRFWNEMQKLRPDCRFVYVTHDLPFGLSRANATYVVIMPSSPPQIRAVDDGLPKELAESLLAAASFSIHAKRIVFCEGIEGPSIHQALFTTWFNGQDTAVIPVESCENVVQCTSAFGNSNLVIGGSSIGLIDRDYWPDHYLNSLPGDVSVLPYHEVESLFCLPGVFAVVAKHLGIAADDAKLRYEDVIGEAKAKFVDGILHKQISERYKRRCEHQFRLSINGVGASDNFNEMSESHIKALDSQAWEVVPEVVLVEEKARLEAALAGTVDGFLKYFPGKVFYKRIAAVLGMTSSTYVELFCSSLSAGIDSNLRVLGTELAKELEAFLPPRFVVEAQ